jgi:RimJ/RimL family protein N-acetyltransferase
MARAPCGRGGRRTREVRGGQERIPAMFNKRIEASIRQIILTDRLALIPQTPAHAKEMFRILNDLSLHEYTGGQPPKSEEWLENRFKRFEPRVSPDGSEIWLNYVVQMPNSELIGYVQATVTAQFAYIAWVVGSKWQRHGYAGEASLALVQWLIANDAKKIRACVNPSHRASQCVAKRAGLNRTSEMIDGEEVWELNMSVV